MDPRAEAEQPAVLLVHAHAPALLRKSETSGEPRNAGAGNRHSAFHTPNPSGANKTNTAAAGSATASLFISASPVGYEKKSPKRQQDLCQRCVPWRDFRLAGLNGRGQR